MRYLLPVLFSLLVETCYCQKLQIKKIFSDDRGFPVLSIAQDKLGYIWFCRPQTGLTRYDGREFRTISASATDNNSLASNYVECLLFDDMNNMWIGLYGEGLDRYDMVTKRFTHNRHNDKDSFSISNDTVTCLLIDKHKNLWIGTYKGVNVLDQKTGRFKHYLNEAGNPSSLSHNHVKCLYEDKKGTIWVGTGSPFNDVGESNSDGGLNKLNQETGTFTRYKNIADDSLSLANNKVRALFEDSKGNFWVGTAGNGLHIMDRVTGTFKRYPYDARKPLQLSRPPIVDIGGVDHITFITEDELGGIWISTLQGGINRYDPATGKIDLYGKTFSFSTFESKSIDTLKRLDDFGFWQGFKTTDNSLWFPSYSGSIYTLQYNRSLLPFYDDDGRDGNTFFVDSSTGILWVGTERGLMQKTTAGKLLKVFTHDPANPNTIGNDTIGSMRVDKRGRIWLAGTSNLSVFDRATSHFTNYYNIPSDPNSFKGVSVGTLAIDKSGKIWMGSNNMLECLVDEKGVFKHYFHSETDTNSICSGNIFSIFPDNTNGNLWIATFRGVDMLDVSTGKFVHFLRKDPSRAVFVDHEGTVWAGRDNLLYRMRKGENNFSVFDYPFLVKNGEDVIIHIMEDDLHNLWVDASNALIRINPQRTEGKRFGKDFGVRENSFSFCDNYKSPDGKLYFGNQFGYFSFYPDKLPPEPFAPVVHLNSFVLEEEEILPSETGLLRKPIWDTKEVTLSYDQNVFSIDFISVNYHSLLPNHYYFKLENYDNNWHSLENEHKAFFYNIPPGVYIFHGRVLTEGGNSAECSLKLIIRPPWWKTKFAYAVYIMLFLVTAFLTSRIIRNRIIEKERARNRDKELEHAKEIEIAYGELKTTQAQLIQAEKMASLGQLTAGIAHEIQNPLNFVNNFSDVNKELISEMVEEADKGNMAEVKSIAADIRENCEKINHHGKRADAIVKGMLEHSRQGTGQKEPTAINTLADEYLKLAYQGIRAKDNSFNVVMKTEYDESIAKVNIIPQDIGRVLLNLYNNAFYAVKEKQAESRKLQVADFEPAITVTTRKDSNNIIITVADNGNGIPQNIIDKIFQPFFTTKPTGQGTGLGLSLAYDIVKAHGGEIIVESREGQGTEFIIRLPC